MTERFFKQAGLLAVALLTVEALTATADEVDLRTVQVVCCDTNSPGCRQAAAELEKHLGLVAGTRKPVAGGWTFAVGKRPAGEPEPAAFVSKAKVVGRTVCFWGEEAEHGEESTRGPLFAVYEFLEKALGVRWFFPGDEGIGAPKRASVELKEGDAWRFEPALEMCSFRVYDNWKRRYKKSPGVPKEFQIARKDFDRIHSDMRVWYDRMRLASRDRQKSGHAFTDWQGRYLKDHPDWFAYIEHPDLVRDGKPGRGVKDSEARRIHACHSNPDVAAAVVADWQAKGAPRRLNLCLNDGKYCFCHCPNCLALDTRREGEDFLDHLTDRVVYFYNNVMERAMKVRPDVDAVAYAYSTYRNPPRREKLRYGDNMTISFVAAFGDDYEKNMEDWAAVGMRRFYLRPNYMCYAAVFPRGAEKYLYDVFKAGLKHGMVGVMYDGMPRPVTDLEYYVIATLARCPERGFDGIVDEFYTQYGAAASVARAYFERVRGRSDRFVGRTRGAKDAAVRQRLDDSELAKYAFGGATEEELVQDLAVLEQGRTAELRGLEKSCFDKLVLRARHALLTYRFLKASKGSDAAAFAAATKALHDFRVANFTALGCEGASWFSKTNSEREAWTKAGLLKAK